MKSAEGFINGTMLRAKSTQIGFSGSTVPYPSSRVPPLRTTAAMSEKLSTRSGLSMKRATDAKVHAGEFSSRNNAESGLER